MKHRSKKARKRAAPTINPFVSEAQRRACYAGAMPGVDCAEWESKTEGKLPKRKPTRNSILKIDPSRTVTLRRQHIAALRRRFNTLRAAILKLVWREDAFGLEAARNQFCATGVGGGVDPTCTPSSAVGKVIGAVKDAEHWAADKFAKGFGKLPVTVQDALQGTRAVAFAGWTASQSLAERISKEKGSTPEQAAKLRATLAAADIVAFKPASIASASLGPAVAAASWVVPPVTGLYLAYSAARHPIATFRAAKSLVRDIASGARAAVSTALDIYNSSPKAAGEALAEHGYDDWYAALLHAADMDVSLAERAFRAQPLDDSSPQPDDVQWLRSQAPTTNSNPEGCNQYTGPGCGVGRFSAQGINTREDVDKMTKKDLKKFAESVGGVVQDALRGLSDKGQRDAIKHYITVDQRKRETADEPPAKEQHADVDKAVKDVESFLRGKEGQRVYVADVRDAVVSAGHAHDTVSEAMWKLSDMGKASIYRLDDPREITERHSAAALKTLTGEKHILYYGGGSAATTNAGRFAFHTSPEKVEAFQRWLQAQYKALLTSKAEEEAWRKYAEAGYRKGAGRAFDDSRAAARTASAGDQDRMSFYAGTREEFLKSSFGAPVAVEKVKLLAGRSFDDLENVTADMSARMSRTLTDGLVEGKGARAVARDMMEDVDIGEERALTIARTEIIRAHAEGQLDAFDNLGVEEIGIEAEWSTAGDDRVCPECGDMEGTTLAVDDARGMIPMHPNCRCAFIPVLPDELTGNQLIDRFSTILNVFCPTGVGGGVDPTCSPGGRDLPYSRSTDIPRLTATEKTEYNGLFREQQSLYKKIKGGTATDAEKQRSDAVKSRLNQLSDIGKARVAGSGSTPPPETKPPEVKPPENKPPEKVTDPQKELHDLQAQIPKMTDKELRDYVEKRSTAETSPVKVHGMPLAENMHSATIGGVVFKYPEGKSHLVAETLKNVLGYQSDIKGGQYKLWAANSEIIHSSNRNSVDDYWAQKYNMPGFQSLATAGGGNRSICVYSNNSLSRSSFYHEAGHNFATQEWGQTKPPYSSAYGKAQTKENPVSEYGKASKSEDFAEACSEYAMSTSVRAPGESKFKNSRERLRDKYPKKYKALQEMLGD